MVKILIAEQDEKLNSLIAGTLTAEGYDVRSCHDGISAVKALESDSFQLILSDTALPGSDALTELNRTVKAVRPEKRDRVIPVLFIAGLSDGPSKKHGFIWGVDDYIIKPFDSEELILRVSAVLTRARIKYRKEITAGNFRMNKEQYTAYLGSERIDLSVREFEMLYKMLSHPQKTFTRSQLMNEFSDGVSSTSRTVDVYIAKIRDKVSACDSFEIVTVHGLGYKIILL